MKKSKKAIKIILVLPLVLGLFLLCLSSLVSASQTGTVVATVSINPLTVKISAPSVVRQGRLFKVRARIGNLDQSKIEEVKAIISVPLGLAVQGAAEKKVGKVGVIRGGKEKRVSWRVLAEETGNHFILVEASGIEEESGDPVKAGGGTMVVVEVQNSRGFWSLIKKFLASL